MLREFNDQWNNSFDSCHACIVYFRGNFPVSSCQARMPHLQSVRRCEWLSFWGVNVRLALARLVSGTKWNGDWKKELGIYLGGGVVLG